MPMVGKARSEKSSAFFMRSCSLTRSHTGGFWADQIGMSRRVRKSDLDVVPGVPAIYPISPTVLPRDPKWGSNVHVVGYWFLEKMNEYQPSLALVDFLERKLDKRPVIFIGFGSMKVKRADEFTKKILRAVHKLGVRVVLSMGWSDESTVQETSEEQLKRMSGGSGTLFCSSILTPSILKKTRPCLCISSLLSPLW